MTVNIEFICSKQCSGFVIQSIYFRHTRRLCKPLLIMFYFIIIAINFPIKYVNDFDFKFKVRRENKYKQRKNYLLDFERYESRKNEATINSLYLHACRINFNVELNLTNVDRHRQQYKILKTNIYSLRTPFCFAFPLGVVDVFATGAIIKVHLISPKYLYLRFAFE